MYPLMFVTPDLEKAFRKLTDSPHEVGGYLFVNTGTIKPHNRTQLKSALGYKATIGFITSWIVLPNVAKEPSRTYQPAVNYDILSAAAQATAASLESHWYFHFHTHPDWAWMVTPSEADFQFWMGYCKIADYPKRSDSIGVIASRGLMAMSSFHVKLDKVAQRATYERQPFFSWKRSGLREYRKARGL